MLLKVFNALYVKKECRPIFNTICDLNLWYLDECILLSIFTKDTLFKFLL